MRTAGAVVLVIASACARSPATSTITASVGDEPVVYESHPYFKNFLPFGAGQFQNDEPGKGVAFAIGQGVTGATSVGLFVYLATHYADGGVPLDEAWRVRRLQQLEIGSGCAVLGLYAWSVIDGIVHHQPWVKRARANVALTPTLEPGGAGVALSWSR